MSTLRIIELGDCDNDRFENIGTAKHSETQEEYEIHMQPKYFDNKYCGRYIHAKTGNDYQVIGVGKEKETEDLLVVYKRVSGSKDVWARPFDMFFEDVDINGTTQPRFKRVGVE